MTIKDGAVIMSEEERKEFFRQYPGSNSEIKHGWGTMESSITENCRVELTGRTGGFDAAGKAVETRTYYIIHFPDGISVRVHTVDK